MSKAGASVQRQARRRCSRRRHRRAQVLVTVAVGLSTATTVVADHVVPGLRAFAPLAGFGASLVWIWLEEL